MPGQRNTGLSAVSGIVITGDDYVPPIPSARDDRIPRGLGGQGTPVPATALTDDLGSVLTDDLGETLEVG